MLGKRPRILSLEREAEHLRPLMSQTLGMLLMADGAGSSFRAMLIPWPPCGQRGGQSWSSLVELTADLDVDVSLFVFIFPGGPQDSVHARRGALG